MDLFHRFDKDESGGLDSKELDAALRSIDVNLTKSELTNQQELLDLKIARYDARLTALIDNVKDNARGIIEEILEEKEQEPQKRKDWNSPRIRKRFA